jgi:hypothetical protein
MVTVTGSKLDSALVLEVVSADATPPRNQGVSRIEDRRKVLLIERDG